MEIVFTEKTKNDTEFSETPQHAADVWKVYLKLGKFSKKFREIDVALNFPLFLATLDFLKNIFGAFRHMETYIIWIKIL